MKRIPASYLARHQRRTRFVRLDIAWRNSVMKEGNLKSKAACVAATLLIGLVPAVCHAQDFSADVTYLPTGKPDATSGGADTSAHNPSKLYVSKDKIRLETRGLAGAILLVNEGEQTAFALFPATKEYQPLVGGLSEYFSVKDPQNACPDWQRAAIQKINCEKVGHQVVDGRQTVKYQNEGASDTATFAVWIDLGLKFVVKWESAGTSVELRNIQEAQQAASLFTLPSDYEFPKPRKGTNKGFSNRGP